MPDKKDLKTDKEDLQNLTDEEIKELQEKINRFYR
jgi:hypothetical protein